MGIITGKEKEDPNTNPKQLSPKAAAVSKELDVVKMSGPRQDGRKIIALLWAGRLRPSAE